MEAAPPGFMVKRGARGKSSTDIDRTPSQSLSSPTAGSVLATAASLGAASLSDTPYGFGDRVPPLTSSVVAFQRRCEWFYVDPAGEEHGPVPLQKIINWHKKGHFPEDVKVRCRSPWFGVGALVKSLEEAQDVDTPTAAALGRAGGSGSWSNDGITTAGSVGPIAAVPPPPPPPPRQGSISGYGLSTPGGYEAELNGLFVGSGSWGDEPVWYYIDRSDQVQGPFSAREMIGWVSAGMLKDDIKMCPADAKLGIPPARNQYQTLTDLLATYRRRKAPVPGPGVGLQPPPPPPPPRRADSIGDGFLGGSAFGPPGRASDAPTWRKDIPAPLPPGSNHGAGDRSSGSDSGAAERRRGSSEGGGSAAAAAANADGSSSSGMGATGALAKESSTTDAPQTGGSASDPGAAAAANPTAAAAGRRGSEDSRAANYHTTNAEALNAALAPDQDFEYGDDFKRQRDRKSVV